MAKETLNNADVYPGFKELCGGSMAEHVRCHGPDNPTPLSKYLEACTNLAGSQGAAVLLHKELR
jgi:hypothetical protein